MLISSTNDGYNKCDEGGGAKLKVTAEIWVSMYVWGLTIKGGCWRRGGNVKQIDGGWYAGEITGNSHILGSKLCHILLA